MRKHSIALLGIILLGFALRLFILSQRGSLWFDEAFSVHFASMDLREIWSFLKFENNPPLYFYVLHFWMLVFGNSETTTRLLSMIFGLASIPMVYVLGAKIHSRAAGYFAAFLTAISTFQAFYSTETRMYAMYLFFTLTAVWVFLVNQESRIMNHGLGRRQSQFKSIIPYSLFIILSLLIWTHITAWWFVLVFGVYILWKEKFNLKQFIIHNSSFIILGALLVLQFLPWAANFIRFKIAAPLSQGYFFYLPPDRNYFLDILETFLVFGEDSAFVVTILSGVIIFLLWQALKVRGSGVKLLLTWLAIPLLVGFAFSNAVPRYFIAVAPALYLLMGVGFARYREAQPPKPRRLSFLFPIIMFALVLPDYASLAKIAHHRWDELTDWIVTHESREMKQESCLTPRVSCLILINPHSEVLPFERYYRGVLPVIGFYPREDSDSRDLRVVKTNWVSINTKENVRALADVTEGYNRVFLVTGEIDQTIGRNLVPIWFWENGWIRASSKEFGRLGVMGLVRVP
ncbi:glycosyltransferase family 39 protein [Candidatus Uhrbacteria bacterium]|nr:glycosyltransferase family 39 protein [Candidatus Uhrbacteria bacterium]